jgi:uncharacterized membrane protein YccF (DUF307 family)
MIKHITTALFLLFLMWLFAAHINTIRARKLRTITIPEAACRFRLIREHTAIWGIIWFITGVLVALAYH